MENNKQEKTQLTTRYTNSLIDEENGDRIHVSYQRSRMLKQENMRKRV